MTFILGILMGMILLSSVNGQETTSKDTVNVRTVLFKETDVCKQYWCTEELHLLLARKSMQDLLPRNLPNNFSNLAVYLKKCLDVVKKKLPPDESALVTRAAYDVMGGYLKSVALPILNEAYYAGNVNYATTAELHALYGKVTAALHTDGGGWAQPCDMRKIPTKVQALDIVITNTTESCDALEVRPRSSVGLTCDRKEICRICVPYLDDNAYPGAVAVPLKGNSLFSLMSNGSANLLPKFYILAMRCLASDEFHKRDVLTFNRQFYEWIISTVVPHLQETDRWYPGFGGVMRIVETMNQKGLMSTDMLRPDIEPSQVDVPGIFKELQECDDECSTDGSQSSSRKTVILIIFLVLLFLFICCCCVVCFMKSCSKQQPKANPCEEDVGQGGCTNALMSLYCGVKGSKNKCKKASDQSLKGSSTTDNKTRSTRSSRSRTSRRVNVMHGSDHEKRYYSDSESSGTPLSQRSSDR